MNTTNLTTGAVGLSPDYTTLPRSLYRAASVRELDRLAIEEHAIAGYELMYRAGEAASELLMACWPQAERVAILCGAGNNGGDGYVVAALLKRQGIAVDLYSLVPADRGLGDALSARQLALGEGVPVLQWTGELGADVDVVVDGILGTGLQGEVRPAFREVIEYINRSGYPVLALDIPSGLCSDTGRVLGAAVCARHTISFIGMKQGLLTGQGRACCGHLHFTDLAVPAEVFVAQPADCERLDGSDVAASLPERQRTLHKGSTGHVLVVGGELGMGGAGALAARAAGRSGAGLVSLATREAHVPAVLAQAPEVMVRAVHTGEELSHMLASASVVVVGPGLGQRAWAEQLLLQCWVSDKPLVVDADALNLLAAGRVVPATRPVTWLMTPHPGEAARLLGCSVADIQRDRFAAAAALHKRYRATVLLKGSGSLVVGASQVPGVCPYGNPGMASGGMGDVLSGIVGALLAQGLEATLALRLATVVHSQAADICAGQAGERGLLASDLLPVVRLLLNPPLAAVDSQSIRGSLE